MNDLMCPYCQHNFDSDDIYVADMYHEQSGSEIKCPTCSKKFFADCYIQLKYSSCTKEEYEEYESVEDANLFDL